MELEQAHEAHEDWLTPGLEKKMEEGGPQGAKLNTNDRETIIGRVKAWGREMLVVVITRAVQKHRQFRRNFRDRRGIAISP